MLTPAHKPDFKLWAYSLGCIVNSGYKDIYMHTDCYQRVNNIDMDRKYFLAAQSKTEYVLILSAGVLKCVES